MKGIILLMLAIGTMLNQSSGIIINDSFLKQHLPDIPQIRMMSEADLEREGRQDLLTWTPGLSDPGFIRVGDFNHDFVVDVVVLAKSDDVNYEDKMFVCIFSFPCNGNGEPVISYFTPLFRPVGVIDIIEIKEKKYPIIGLTFVEGSGDSMWIFWDKDKYVEQLTEP